MISMNFQYIRINNLLQDKRISIISPSLKLQKDDINDFGKTAVISQDKEFISGYTDLIDKKLVEGSFTIFGDHTEIFKFIDFPFAQGADGIKILKADDRTIASKYLYYSLKNCYYPTGFYQRHFKLLRKTYIPDLDINHQKQIVTVLNNYDQLIENNSKRIELLESMAEELYKEWFVNTRNTCEIKKLSELMKDYFNGGWGKEKLETKEKNEGYVIRGTDIPDILNSCFDNIPHRYHSDNDIRNKQLEENDIIMELSNGNINNIGRTLLINKELLEKYNNLMCASFCKTMRFNNKKDSLSTLLLIRYLQNSGKMFFYKNTGTNGINNFNFKRFLKQDIYILDDDIFCEVSNLYELADNYRQKNYNLTKQRDSLLPRLMSGKLSVEGKEVI